MIRLAVVFVLVFSSLAGAVEPDEILADPVQIGFCTIPGAFVGRWIVRSTPLRIHSLLMEGFMLCGAAYFLWEAAGRFGWR